MVSQTISFNVNNEIMKRLLHQQKLRKRTGLSIDQYAKSLCYEKLSELELGSEVANEKV